MGPRLAASFEAMRARGELVGSFGVCEAAHANRSLLIFHTLARSQRAASPQLASQMAPAAFMGHRAHYSLRAHFRRCLTRARRRHISRLAPGIRSRASQAKWSWPPVGRARSSPYRMTLGGRQIGPTGPIRVRGPHGAEASVLRRRATKFEWPHHRAAMV